jgi:hypothetical protein
VPADECWPTRVGRQETTGWSKLKRTRQELGRRRPTGDGRQETADERWLTRAGRRELADESWPTGDGRCETLAGDGWKEWAGKIWLEGADRKWFGDSRTVQAVKKDRSKLKAGKLDGDRTCAGARSLSVRGHSVVFERRRKTCAGLMATAMATLMRVSRRSKTHVLQCFDPSHCENPSPIPLPPFCLQQTELFDNPL